VNLSFLDQRRIVLAVFDGPAASGETTWTSGAQAAHQKRAAGVRDLTSSTCLISTVTRFTFLFTIRPPARGRFGEQTGRGSDSGSRKAVATPPAWY
jgi:hypothetical protein